MSDTIWVAIITACATTIPQIIIAIINKNKEIKLKKFEYYNQNRLQVIFDFLDAVGEIYSKDGINLKEKANFQKSLHKLTLYFPKIDYKIFDKIYNSLSEWDVTSRHEALQPLIKELSKSIKDI